MRRARAGISREALSVAAGRMMWRNKRRWGGYIVHLGMVVVFAGIAGSSSYQKETVGELVPGEPGHRRLPPAYLGHQVVAEDDHLGTIARFQVTQDGVRRHAAGRAAAHVNLVFPVLKEAFSLAKAVPRGRIADAPLAVYGLIAEMEGRAGREVKTPSTEVGIASLRSPLAPHALRRGPT